MVKRREFTLERGCGLFSNLSVAASLLAQAEYYEIAPQKVRLIPTLYTDKDVYKLLFRRDERVVIDRHLIAQQHKNWHAGRYGFLENAENLGWVNQIYRKYFGYSELVEKHYDRLFSKLDPEKCVFFWLRKTDKITENEVPSFREMLNWAEAAEMDHKNLTLLIRTDDPEILEEIRVWNRRARELFKDVHIIPYPGIDHSAGSDRPVYLRLATLDDQQAKALTGGTATDHLVQILCVAKLASKCAYFFSYGGNVSSFVVCLRRSTYYWDDPFMHCRNYIFKNQHELLPIS